MKRIVFTIACCLAAIASIASLAAHAASTGGLPCIPKLGKLNGKPIVYECGPATGTLSTGGKTFTYTKGFCSQSKSAGSELELDLGVLAATAKGNAGQPYLSIDVAMAGGTVNAYHGGKMIANNLVALTGHFPSQGTFKAKYSGAGFGAKFGGSWNCHGVIYEAP